MSSKHSLQSLLSMTDSSGNLKSQVYAISNLTLEHIRWRAIANPHTLKDI